MSHVYRRLLTDFGRNYLLPSFVKVRDRYSEGRLVRSVSEAYEDLLGIKEVKQTQQIVLKAEADFSEASRIRREIHFELSTTQEELKQLRSKLDGMSRTEEAYLEMITKEHQLLKKENSIMTQLKRQEDLERDFFATFSRSLRDSQEVERMRQEKTKYLSLIGSIIGAALGIIGTSVNHAMKRNDFKKILEAIETSNQSQELLVKRVIEDAKEVSHPPPQEQPEAQTVTTESLETQIGSLIQTTESNLEFKMKMNALTTVTVLYALIAVTLPFIMKLAGD